jgi:hypothetical protein
VLSPRVPASPRLPLPPSPRLPLPPSPPLPIPASPRPPLGPLTLSRTHLDSASPGGADIPVCPRCRRDIPVPSFNVPKCPIMSQLLRDIYHVLAWDIPHLTAATRPTDRRSSHGSTRPDCRNLMVSPSGRDAVHSFSAVSRGPQARVPRAHEVAGAPWALINGEGTTATVRARLRARWVVSCSEVARICVRPPPGG